MKQRARAPGGGPFALIPVWADDGFGGPLPEGPLPAPQMSGPDGPRDAQSAQPNQVKKSIGGPAGRSSFHPPARGR